jgi:hypothetical protein
VPPEQIQQHRRPFLALGHIENSLKGGMVPGDDAHLLALLEKRPSGARLLGRVAQTLDERRWHLGHLPAEPHQRGDPHGAAHRRPGQLVVDPNEEVIGKETLSNEKKKWRW